MRFRPCLFHLFFPRDTFKARFLLALCQSRGSPRVREVEENQQETTNRMRRLSFLLTHQNNLQSYKISRWIIINSTFFLRSDLQKDLWSKYFSLSQNNYTTNISFSFKFQTDKMFGPIKCLYKTLFDKIFANLKN